LKSNAERSAALDELREEVGLRGPKSEGISDEERSARWETFRQRTGEVDAEFPPADVAVYCDHIDHIVEVAGIDHVGIGSDFDGGGGIGGWQDAAESRNVTRELVKRGYSEQDIQKIWSGNLLRVWRAVEAVSADA
jgi:membrane dipeptidase